MHILIGALALLTIAADQRVVDQDRLAQLRPQALQKQIDARSRTVDTQRQNDRLRDFAAARVKQCVDGAKNEKNPLLSGQMCVAASYLRDAEFRTGFDSMLQVVDPATARQTREVLLQLIAILNKNGMEGDMRAGVGKP